MHATLLKLAEAVRDACYDACGYNCRSIRDIDLAAIVAAQVASHPSQMLLCHDCHSPALCNEYGNACDAASPPPAVAVPETVIKLGLYGKAFDGPRDYRAYTYKHQPGNIDASMLGRAMAHVSPEGDFIDRGLSLLKELQTAGFGVFQLAAIDTPMQATPKEGD